MDVVFEAVAKLYINFFKITFDMWGYTVSIGSIFIWCILAVIFIKFIKDLVS